MALEWESLPVTQNLKSKLWEQARICLESVELIALQKLSLSFAPSHSLVRLETFVSGVKVYTFLLVGPQGFVDFDGNRSLRQMFSDTEGQLLLGDAGFCLAKEDLSTYVQMYFMATEMFLLCSGDTLHNMEQALNWNTLNCNLKSRWFQAKAGHNLLARVYCRGFVQFMEVSVTICGKVTTHSCSQFNELSELMLSLIHI